MRKAPDSAQSLQENARGAVDDFAQAEPQPPQPDQIPRAFFVTRHPGAVEWARRHGIEAEAVHHLDPSAIRPGDTVIGTLPVHLAAEVCARRGRYLHLVLDLPPEARGRDLSAEEMDRHGARLQECQVSMKER
ncbi:MAG: CRISPR-associated protein Csx16 [Alphaproteobacteria bacterium]|nr:MAG: CRISPR-associated protein Csx16 [Alphaproteobacteria bacterium]